MGRPRGGHREKHHLVRNGFSIDIVSSCPDDLANEPCSWSQDPHLRDDLGGLNLLALNAPPPRSHPVGTESQRTRTEADVLDKRDDASAHSPCPNPSSLNATDPQTHPTVSRRGQTPIYNQLRGERINAYVPTSGADSQTGAGHCGQHPLHDRRFRRRCSDPTRRT